jgi:adenylate cyclase class IV
MIEVEKKFQPTEEQLAALLKDCEFVGKKDLHDVYYDYPDYRMIKKLVFLRRRNNNLELKAADLNEINNQGTAYLELDKEEDIQNYFKTNNYLEDFIKENLIEIMNFKTFRKKYKKGDFNIDIDEMDFGYKCVEIELLIPDISQAKEAKAKIIKLAGDYNMEVKDLPQKRKEYFRIVKPDVYNELYGQKG